MSEPLRPVGAEFEAVRETEAGRVVDRYRIVGHDKYDGQVTELIILVSSTPFRKTPPAPSERK